MKQIDIPTQFPIAFASSAGPTFIETIPEASQIGITDGRASLTDGFVPLNFDPVAAGGIPPFGKDVNGILFMISLWSQWQGAGGPVLFDAVFAAAIGGYPKGTLLTGTTTGILWQSQADDNTTDPDAGPSADWLNVFLGRQIDLQVFASPGTFTFTPVPGATRHRVRACGGGAAGGGTQATSGAQCAVGGGGTGGGQGEVWIDGDLTGTTVTVGAPGTPASGAIGGSGGFSGFGSFLVVPGGNGGLLGTAAAPAFVGGGGPATGLPTSAGASIINLCGGQTGGLGFAFSLSNAASGQGAACFGFGVGGSPAADTAGIDAVGFGAGGGGACALASRSARAGGNPGGGKVIVEGYS